VIYTIDMFASRLSQPMLRLVGLWQQFQQANLAVQRMGDINQLKEKVSMMFITHAMPKNLLVDEVVNIGQGVLGSVGDGQAGDQQEVGV